jgi:predicted alpha/beta-fold hydrolase
MLPPEVLDEVRAIARSNPALHLEFTRRGGHAGFISGSIPWRPFYYAEYRACEFIAEQFAARPATIETERRKA